MFSTYQTYKIKLPGRMSNISYLRSNFLELTPEQKDKVISIGMQSVLYAEQEVLKEHIQKLSELTKYDKKEIDRVSFNMYKNKYIDLKNQNDILHKQILYYQHKLLSQLQTNNEEKNKNDEDFENELEKYST